MLSLWLAVICLVAVGAGIGRKVRIPDAVLWCALGFAAAFVPRMRDLRLSPELSLFLLLPPLVYASAVRLPWPQFRDNLRPISLLAIGLVLVNTVLIALAAHAVVPLSWPAAVALGALVSPTDPVAATAVAARAGLPDRLVAILEGEGLVNDAVALTVLRIAIAAAATGHFSVSAGLERFFAILIGEPLYGCLVGASILWLRSRIEDPRLEITISLLTPFAAYLLPEHLGGSGILATVAAGMYVGERMSDVVPAGTRLQSTSVWEIVVFLLNGILFLIAGMELRRVLQPHQLRELYLVSGLLIAGLAVAVRAGWCAAVWAIFRGRSLLREQNDRPMPSRHMAVIAWSGMRGPISLAAALAVPVLGGGARLPHLQVLVFVTAIVIVVTLMVQGLGLPLLVGKLGIGREAERDRREGDRQFQLGNSEAARAALERLSQLEAQGRASAELAGHLRRNYRARLEMADADGLTHDVRSELIRAERARISELRKEGRIDDRTQQELERRLDLRESGLANRPQ
jgi:CPA1 family monovalent cation:H+ antiporter